MMIIEKLSASVLKDIQGCLSLFKDVQAMVQFSNAKAFLFIAIGLVDSLVDEMLLVSNQVCLGSSIRSMITMYY